jgi:DNA-binding IclR family transcriptional regulator
MDLNRSVQRACSVLEAFTAAEPRLTLAELAARVDLPKPTTYRLAGTLVGAGFMTQHRDGRYGLGVRLMDLGSVAREDLDVVEVCGPVMERLAEQTGETIILGLVDWAALEVTIVHRVDSAHDLSVVSRVGRRSVVTPGAIGKALLMGLDSAELGAVSARVDLTAHTDRSIHDRDQLIAEIERCRSLGYATERGEFIADVSAVAAAVLSDGHRPLAAVAVVGPSSRLDSRLGEIGEMVRVEAERLRGTAAG